MHKVRFIKDHPSKRFKKGDKIEIPDEILDVWIQSGYIETNSLFGKGGKVEAPSDGGASSSKNSTKFGKSQSKSSKKKTKKRK
jgi:hypothetical protein